MENGPKKYEKARKHLKQYISRKSHRNLLTWKQDDDEIIFHKGFCEEVLQVSHRFFTKLFAVLRSEEEGDF